MANSQLSADPVFRALTQPQMIGGVTYSYAVFNLIVTLELFLVTRSFWSFAFTGCVHIVGYMGCLREPRFFDLWLTRLRYCPRTRNFRFWRANAYRP